MNRAGHKFITERKPRYVVASYHSMGFCCYFDSLIKPYKALWTGALVSTNVPQAAHQAPTGRAREQFSLKVDGLTAHFTLEGERIVALKDQIAQTTQNAFGYYLKLFGKAPQQALGEKYTSVPIDIKQGEKWEGETETSMFRWRVIEP